MSFISIVLYYYTVSLHFTFIVILCFCHFLLALYLKHKRDIHLKWIKSLLQNYVDHYVDQLT